jgi:hypothetical protein
VRIETVDDPLRVVQAMGVDDHAAEWLPRPISAFLQQVEEHGANVGPCGAGHTFLAGRMLVQCGLQADHGHIVGLLGNSIGGDDRHSDAARCPVEGRTHQTTGSPGPGT